MIPSRWCLGDAIVLGSPGPGAFRRTTPRIRRVRAAAWPPASFPPALAGVSHVRAGEVLLLRWRCRVAARRCHTQVWTPAVGYPSGVTAGWLSGMTTRP
jgi:hypothetical protein